MGKYLSTKDKLIRSAVGIIIAFIVAWIVDYLIWDWASSENLVLITAVNIYRPLVFSLVVGIGTLIILVLYWRHLYGILR